MATKKFIQLGVKGTKRTQSFEAQQALSLLRLQNSQWEVTDTKYEFSNNEIRPRKGKESNKDA